jgi:hypothetical protein
MAPVYCSYKAGDIIYEAKENADSVFLIHTGEVNIVSRIQLAIATFWLRPRNS